MDKKKKHAPFADPYGVDYSAMTTTVSSTETTGLMTAPPKNREEYESLLDNAPTETPRIDAPPL